MAYGFFNRIKISEKEILVIKSDFLYKTFASSAIIPIIQARVTDGVKPVINIKKIRIIDVKI